MKKDSLNAIQINRIRCIVGLIGCIIMIAVVQYSYATALTLDQGISSENVGIRTLRMFTTLSNLLVTISAVLCIPYQIEGLRNHNYHLPNWIVMILYVGVTGVSVTFVTAATAISAVQGFKIAMLSRTNLFLHLINPILAIILFTLINDDHTIPFKRFWISLIPMFIYTILYIIFVFVTKKWDDHYSFNKFIPWPLTMLIMYSMAFGISNLLRFLHNKTHIRRKNQFRNYFQNSPDIKSDTIEEAIIKLAHINKIYYLNNDITIPKRSINMIKEAYQTNLTNEQLYNIYINHFLND